MKKKILNKQNKNTLWKVSVEEEILYLHYRHLHYFVFYIRGVSGTEKSGGTRTYRDQMQDKRSVTPPSPLMPS